MSEREGRGGEAGVDAAEGEAQPERVGDQLVRERGPRLVLGLLRLGEVHLVPLLANAEVAAENMAAFAEVAKKVQMETVELFLAAGKTIQEDAASAVKKAADDVTAATKKATAAAK